MAFYINDYMTFAATIINLIFWCIIKMPNIVKLKVIDPPQTNIYAWQRHRNESTMLMNHRFAHEYVKFISFSYFIACDVVLQCKLYISGDLHT